MKSKNCCKGWFESQCAVLLNGKCIPTTDDNVINTLMTFKIKSYCVGGRSFQDKLQVS